MKLDIIGGSYQHKYRNFNSQRTINWYCVPGTPSEKDKNPTALFPTPGLTPFVTLPGRYIRALKSFRTPLYTRCFAVVDTTLYEIFGNMSYISRGSVANIGTGSSKVYLTCDYNNEVGIFHNQAAYFLNMVTNVLTQITTNQYPGLAQTADYLDGYTVISSGGAVFFNTNASLANWTITNTYAPTFKTDPVIAIAALREEIYNFTSQSIEIYINDGTTPYSRLPRSTVFLGLVGKETLVTINDGFIFLNRNEKGECSVYMFDGYYTAVPISPLSINWAINSVKETLDEAYAYIQYTKNGNIWYYLTVPALGQTFCYDVITKQWFERSSLNPVNDVDGTNNYAEFRGRHYTDFVGNHLFADLYSGTVFLEDFNNMTENGNTIMRTRISQNFCDEKKRISAHSLEIDCNVGDGTTINQGSTPIMMMSYSKDSGFNYGQTRNMLLGSIGQHSVRARKHKLGDGRDWTVKLVVTDPVDIMIQSAFFNGFTGSY